QQSGGRAEAGAKGVRREIKNGRKITSSYQSLSLWASVSTQLGIVDRTGRMGFYFRRWIGDYSFGI
ncbi:MAG TPA: hypothetical protein PK867_31185, partial [Pirellulales bacterium]|nr:hypothetical protein [Pirellulales bacterium]